MARSFFHATGPAVSRRTQRNFYLLKLSWGEGGIYLRYG